MALQEGEVLTNKFQVSFPKIFKPQVNDLGEDVYSVTCVFDNEEDFKSVKKIALAAAKERFGDKMDDPKFKKKFKWPFKTEDDIDLERFPNFEGKYYFDAKTKYAPSLIDQKRQDIIDEDDFYAGCYARAVVTAFPYDTGSNRGVSIGLQAIQKMADGERLGGGKRNTADLFGEIETDDSDDDFEI